MNKENKTLFIKTKDADTAEELKKSGFELVDSANGTWTFINEPERVLTFDNKKVAYSNKLCF